MLSCITYLFGPVYPDITYTYIIGFLTPYVNDLSL